MSTAKRIPLSSIPPRRTRATATPRSELHNSELHNSELHNAAAGCDASSTPARPVLGETMSLEQAIAKAMMRFMKPAGEMDSGEMHTHQMHTGEMHTGEMHTGESRPGSATLRLQTLPVARASSNLDQPRGKGPVVSFRPGPQTMKAIFVAAAIIACADGKVSDAERMSLLQFLRQKGILEREGRAAATAAFDQAVALAVKLGLDEPCAAMDLLEAVKEGPGAPLVAHAASVVALADGIGWPQEIAMLEVIRDRLGLRAGSRQRAREMLH